MTFHLHAFADKVLLTATERGLVARAEDPTVEVGRRETWPFYSISAPGAWKTAIEIEQMLELGLATSEGRGVLVPYEQFDAVEDAQIDITAAWTPGNPFLLKIDRHSDIGRPDFSYRYEFMTSARPVYVERLGYYIRRADGDTIFAWTVRYTRWSRRWTGSTPCPPPTRRRRRVG